MSLADAILGSIKIPNNALQVSTGYMEVKYLANALNTTGTKTSLEYGVDNISWPASFQLIATGRGSNTTAVEIEVSNDDINYSFYCYLSLSGGSTGITRTSGIIPWKYVRITCTILQNPGTGTYSVIML